MMNTENFITHKILAAYFAATMGNQTTPEFEAFVYQRIQANQFRQLQRWWEGMDALRVIRHAARIVQSNGNEQLHLEPIVTTGKNAIVCLNNQPIGKIYGYQKIVLPQELQIRIAYDSLIERFLAYLQRKKYGIRLAENDLTIRLFVPQTHFELENEWHEFIKFAYSKGELYKSFTLFVNSLKLTDRGFGYVRFP